MKKIYSFELKKSIETEEPFETTNENGEKVTTHKKVNKEIPCTFFIRKPTREITDQANLYYGEVLAEGVKRGLLTIPQLEKRYSNDGGIFSDYAKNKYETLYTDYSLALLEEERLKKEGNPEKQSEHELKLKDLEKELQEYERYKTNLFENTAEMRARNNTLVWWLINLSYKVENNKELPLFPGEAFRDKLIVYDELLESDESFHKTLLKKLSYYISFWSSGQAKKPEDFEAFEKNIEEKIKFLGLE